MDEIACILINLDYLSKNNKQTPYPSLNIFNTIQWLKIFKLENRNNKQVNESRFNK